MLLKEAKEAKQQQENEELQNLITATKVFQFV
jgi:hypothetical protein